MKNEMRGKRFDNANAAVDAMNAILGSIPKEVMQSGIDHWFLRMNKCIRAEGCYFEKL
jgi:hypothetical protein